MAAKITQWSFSRWSTYQKCPALAKYKFIDKLPEPSSPPMERGTAIHKLAEDYTLGTLKKLPPELKLFTDEFKQLRKEKHRHIEEQWAFRRDWTECDWFDKDCWVRIKLDAAYINVKYNALIPIDHKTGKFRPENNEEYMLQLELYALAGLAKFPDVEVVSPRLWYLDSGIIHPNPAEEELIYTPADKPRLIKLWNQRTKPMLHDTTYKPKPNHGCTWCTFSKAKGGPCKF